METTISVSWEAGLSLFASNINTHKQLSLLQHTSNIRMLCTRSCKHLRVAFVRSQEECLQKGGVRACYYQSN